MSNYISLTPDHDCPGNDIPNSNKSGLNLEQCQEWCDNTENCGAIAYDQYNQHCLLKTKAVLTNEVNKDRNCYTKNSHNITKDLAGTDTTQLSSDVTYLTDMLKKVQDRLTALKGKSGDENQQQMVALSEAQDAINSALQDSISQLQQNIGNTHATLKAHDQMLANVSSDITGKQKRAIQQAMDIEQKAELMNTRNRMLELSMEKNIYKRKVIYTILALILAVIVMLVAGYVTFNKA